MESIRDRKLGYPEFKIGNMRKVCKWTVSPEASNCLEEDKGRYLFLQSHGGTNSNRALRIDTKTGKGMLSKPCRHAGFASVTAACGAVEVDVPADIIEQARAQQPKKGDRLGGILVIG